MRNVRVVIAMFALLFAAAPARAQTPLGSGFTYQGVLNSGGAPYNGTADFRFILFNAAAGGAQVGVSQLVSALTVTDGLFAATLDFSAASFNGEERWMSVEVRAPAGGGAFTLLSPRQRIAPTPYALRSLNAAISGTQPNSVSFTNAANAFTGSGAGLTSLSASNIQTGNLSSARLPTSGSWVLSGNLTMGGLLNVSPSSDTVGVGAFTSADRLYVAANSAAHNAIRGDNPASPGSGTGSGVVGETRQTGGAGVIGFNTNTNGTGVVGVGNFLIENMLASGSGGAFTGTVTGVYANSIANDVGQAIYAKQGATDIVRVGYWNGTTFFKINGAGTVSTIVRDPQERKVTMFCPESPEVLLTDYGQARLIDGFAHIELDPTFALNVTINDQHPLRVFIQLEDNEHCEGVVVKNKTATGFDVMELRGGRSNTPFQYQITCNRADEVLDSGRVSQYADVRFPLAPGPEAKVEQVAER